MIIDRVFTPGLSQVAYMIADDAAGEVAVVDPRRDVQAYWNWAMSRKFKITAILETHVHADFVSGARELAMLSGAPVYASRLGGQAFPHQPLDDGDVVGIGALRLHAFWTPGHTPEHLSYLLYTSGEADVPAALFSGDALFVGDVGRPDLLGTEQTKTLSHQLYETVSQRFAALPDEVIVYPGHTAGSACGKKIGDAPHTTIGAERVSNYAFQARDRDHFVRLVLDDMPKPPTYYPVLKRVNRDGAKLIADLPAPHALSPGEVADLRRSGALVVDTRPAELFGNGHVPDSLFAGFGTNFATWMGWVAPFDRDLVLVLTEEVSLDYVVTALRQIGIDRVVGHLEGGIQRWKDAGHQTASLPQVTVQQLAGELKGGSVRVSLLDVRTDEEWRSGHIAGALHIHTGEIAQGAQPDSLEKGERIAVICGSGYRSSVASSVLAMHGYTNLINVAGGMDAWNTARSPVTKSV
jgi:hydroxyacylglutathione hydrolase